MDEKMSDCDCNLVELLHLHHPSSSSSSSSTSSASSLSLRSDDHPRQQQQQLPMEKLMPGEELPLTIFYGGEICVVNVNQHQARSIILLAGRGGPIDEITERVPETWNSLRCDSQNIGLSSLSMKRSLQMFLEKRKLRIQSTNPYQDK